jgi:hypothetical protein
MNTFGSYECTCPIGYALREDQKMCKGKTTGSGVFRTFFAMKDHLLMLLYFSAGFLQGLR